MTNESTALILIGYQNDYFAKDGVLRGVIEESLTTNHVLENTLAMLEMAVDSEATIITTPIVFSPDYRELDNPVGILKVCKDVGAFRASTPGSATIPEFDRFADRMLEIPGKRGLNTFSNTSLDSALEKNGITDVIIAGVVTSVCIDSTARSAADKGFNVTVLSDCTAGRTNFEQEFYCSDIFPIFATVKKSTELFDSMQKA
jgi:nicotinamidase-related amidase